MLHIREVINRYYFVVGLIRPSYGNIKEIQKHGKRKGKAGVVTRPLDQYYTHILIVCDQ